MGCSVLPIFNSIIGWAFNIQILTNFVYKDQQISGENKASCYYPIMQYDTRVEVQLEVLYYPPPFFSCLITIWRY